MIYQQLYFHKSNLKQNTGGNSWSKLRKAFQVPKIIFRADWLGCLELLFRADWLLYRLDTFSSKIIEVYIISTEPLFQVLL